MQSKISDFEPPDDERSILRRSLENILKDYASRHPALPFDKDDPKIDTLVDHRAEFGGNYSQLVSRLTHRFDGTSFQANSDTHLTIDELKEIIEKSSASYPLVELHPEYYDLEAEAYTVQKGQYGYRIPPIIVPWVIEDEAILYDDPTRDHYVEDGPSTRSMSRGQFQELWSRGDLTRWTLWIDQGPQRTLMDVKEAQQ